MGSIFFLILGLLIGSFLNVVILRFEKGEKVTGRSYCPLCKKTLSWYELIPLFSYILQKGKCRTCKARISFQYPLVEILTGTIFLFLFLKSQDTPLQLLFLLPFFSLLIVVAVYDLKTKVIPDFFVALLSLLSFITLFFDFSNFTFAIPQFPQYIWGPVFSLFLASFWFFSRGRAMGLGDAKLVLPLAWWLPFPLAFTGLLFSFWIGAFVSISILLVGRLLGKKKALTMKSEVPFAPFIILGFVLAFFLDFNVLALTF